MKPILIAFVLSVLLASCGNNTGSDGGAEATAVPQTDTVEVRDSL